MSREFLSLDFLKVRGWLSLFLFPALFIIALVFPPLLLLIPAAILSRFLFFPEVMGPAVVRSLSSSVRLPGRRSPPLAV